MSEAIIGLAAAIDALRAELMDAVTQGDGESMQFQIDPIELTVQAVVTKEGSGKIGWKILEVGGSRQSEATQTLTLRLTPVWKTSEGTVTRDFTIAAIGSAGDMIGPNRDHYGEIETD